MDFWDDYEHVDPEVIYIFENIKTKEVEDSIIGELSGCDCIDGCNLSTCECLQRSGSHYSYPTKLNLQNYTINITNSNKPVYECNHNCKCADRICGNRLVQFGPRKNLKIVKIKSKGLGLITEEEIKKGNFICEYVGEVITQKEADRRYQLYRNKNHNYIFRINENFGSNIEKTFIDPTFYGNIGRNINHSCQPNCILVPVRVNDTQPKLCIYANETIEKCTELTFDYGDDSDNCDNNERKPCLCFSPNCRKFLPFSNTHT